MPKQSNDACQPFQPVAQAHIDQLFTIWSFDRRIPTLESRRAWALARNLKPDHVHRWWARRKHLAKKAREKLPRGTYDLPVGDPPVIEIKQQTSPTPTPPPPVTKALAKSRRRRGGRVKNEPRDEDIQLDSHMPSDSSDATLVAQSSSHSSLPPSSPFTVYESSPSLPPSPDENELKCTDGSRIPLFLRLPQDDNNPPECLLEEPHETRLFCTTQDPSDDESEGRIFTCVLCKPDPNNPGGEDQPTSTMPPSLQKDDDDYSIMQLSALPFLLRSPDLLHSQFLDSASASDIPLPGLRRPTMSMERSRICIDGKSFTLDGMLIGSCSCSGAYIDSTCGFCVI